VKRKAVLTIFPPLLLIVVVSAAYCFYALYGAPSTDDAPPGAADTVSVTVTKGRAFSNITRELHDHGLIRYPRIINAYALIRKYDKRIHTGTYQFVRGEKPIDILARLVDGDVLKILVTIPEGFTARQIAGAMAKQAGLDSTAFIDAAIQPELLAHRNIEISTIEGYLFPDSYRIPWGSEPQAVVAMMLSRLDEVFNPSLLRRAEAIEMTPHEVLTLASIIEAEARLPAERATISAVYHNRLKRRMKLEADPTVAYAMGEYKGRLLYKDLEIDSPYNTYLHNGLPPGPICCPGEGSIAAALYPDSTSKALYFVARGDGSHIFSLTLREHLAAVRQVRQAEM
jgi:UPF0755 protein